MAQGWISLNRELMSHWVWDCEFSAGQAWVDLLLYANHSHAKLMIKGQLIELSRGQQARSELTISKAWKWSRNKVRRFLKNLEKDGMIELKSGHLTTVITICNYDSFQSNDTTVETTKGQQSKQLKDNSRNTNNNVNNENNENNTLDQSKIARDELESSSFEYWWAKYPKKMAKKVVFKSWSKVIKKMDEQTVRDLTNHIANDIDYRMELLASGDDRAFGFDRLHPSTYLNQERYNDDI